MDNRGILCESINLYMLYLYIVLLSLNVFAKDVPYTLEDRDRLIRIETSLKEFKEFVDKRFEQADKRVEQLDKRFEQIINFIWMLVAIFVGIAGTTIGFAIWDRRSMIRPFETTVRKIECELKLEKHRVESLILSLRELAKKDEDVSAILKKFNLL